MPDCRVITSDKAQDADGLPDISYETRAQVAAPLDRVGMGDIEMPILLKGDDGIMVRQPAKIDAFVSLDIPHAKGIHMSRLYLTLQELLSSQPLTLTTMKSLLVRFVESQKGLSRAGYVKISFELPVLRKALLSEQVGWRQYPVFLEGSLKNDVFEFVLGARVTYSSTCPCSAALSRQLLQDQFAKDFEPGSAPTRSEVLDWLSNERSIVATPHAQRSHADIKVKLAQPEFSPTLIELIDLVEARLGTPVQAAVKRQDEQEFARLNAKHLMFCEDAARRIRTAFENESRITDYMIRVEHIESLHPHSAVSMAQRGFGA